MHHYHISKHIKKSKKESLYEAFMYLIAFVGPLTTFPQVIEIFSTHSAKDVSLWTWLGYQVLAILWVIYGFKRKDKPLIITEAMWFIMQAFVLYGFFLYR
ncbi:hypothetical protein C5B42_04485 [Candidatus Cerribacteria bacterium 'Amazon FNV 2010 28 9']|uniref:Uncharacterized protein n=1 Tax=Candidatus Cerribacteria bacterium 'Amazon FNV 2010 28 9' TaxID=2081795 RepID=A0A317JN28_9BACT|nr:MAG: hypothetical protein C5B42_04485 [Candidatus Cerribacteria bacterium 'Amazon FNV 2010 28 9']